MSEREKPSGTAPKRRGPLPVAQNATALLRHHLKARGFAQIELVTRWAEIAGATLADHCFPSKLSAAASGGATLTLVADDRAALELQHQTPKLIDKINSYFGKPTVNKIKVVTGEIPRSLPVRPAPRRLSDDEETELLRRTAAVEDPGLRDALTRLGRNAIGESRKTVILKR
ncbi:MAG: DciA family protein [Alphaproteobacteria bacterium]|nr:DciA family protein [Alphaproteobacteria bacterium]